MRRASANEFSFGLLRSARVGLLCAVLRVRMFIKYWLPVVVWFCLIFGASADSGSVRHSSRLIGPLVRWLFPHLPPETVDSVVYFVRKCAHVCEYAVLAWLFWRAFRKPQKNDARPWSSKETWLALLCAAAYSTTDEIHQTFVPGRQGSVWDVLLDSTGAALGLFAVWLIGRWRKKW
jgi:VanZ family protein